MFKENTSRLLIAVFSFMTLTSCGKTEGETGGSSSTGGDTGATCPSPSSYTPTSVSGLVTWLKADGQTGLQSSKVPTWTDRTSSSNSFVQSTASKQPTFVANVINGCPVLRFDGVDDGLQSSSIGRTSTLLNGTSGFTIFLVVANVTLQGTTTSENALVSLIHSASYIGYSLNFRGNSGSNSAIGVSTRLGSGDVAKTSTFTPLTGTKIIMGGANIASDLYLEGSHNTDGYYYGSISGAYFTPTTWISGTAALYDTIGMTSAGAGFFKGDIAEVLIYNTALSNADRTIVTDYLEKKYGL